MSQLLDCAQAAIAAGKTTVLVVIEPGPGGQAAVTIQGEHIPHTPDQTAWSGVEQILYAGLRAAIAQTLGTPAPAPTRILSPHGFVVTPSEGH